MEKRHFIGLAILIAGSFSAGRFLSPRQVEIKEVEKVVYKDREVKDEEKRTRSVRRRVVSPDGTKTIEVVRETDRQSHTEKETDVSKETSKEVKTVSQPNWSVGIYRGTDGISATLDRRILGGFFLGIHGRSDLQSRPEFGIGIRLEF